MYRIVYELSRHFLHQPARRKKVRETVEELSQPSQVKKGICRVHRVPRAFPTVSWSLLRDGKKQRIKAVVRLLSLKSFLLLHGYQKLSFRSRSHHAVGYRKHENVTYLVYIIGILRPNTKR
jgi:hypothetical protein